MRILICSLQVTTGASKGHLHPAIEMGLELNRRGHHVMLLPLPSPCSDEDRKQLERCGINMIYPPPLPDGLPLPPHELGRLAKHRDTAHLAYQSFLVSPLEFQFRKVLDIFKQFQPDIVVYDLLVYAAPLAARMLGIPDIGFCAGLKLIAPQQFTHIYQETADKLKSELNDFLNRFNLTAEFHHLELLSRSHQMVFTPREFIVNDANLPRGTSLTGSLPISKPRCENNEIIHDKAFILLCFGSVLDPANYPELTNIIINNAKQLNLSVMMTTKFPEHFMQHDHVITAEYLPLPQLMTKAAIFIHHGGANTFSESLTIGVPQLLIPLTTDQPIQAEYLRESGAGTALYPHELNAENCMQAFKRLLDQQHPLHHKRRMVQKIFAESHGEIIACDLIEKTAKEGLIA